MICSFNATYDNQKELFFKINNIINLENETYEKELSGVYAIYKNDICLYVGQSKNLASRISTHISGKYKECDFIYLFDVRNLGFSTFFERSDDGKKSILDNCEKYLIKLLKPIENIIADFSFEIPDNQKPDFCFYDYDDNKICCDFIVDCRKAKHGQLTMSNDFETVIIDIDLLFRYGEKYSSWARDEYYNFCIKIIPNSVSNTK